MLDGLSWLVAHDPGNAAQATVVGDSKLVVDLFSSCQTKEEAIGHGFGWNNVAAALVDGKDNVPTCANIMHCPTG